ncbi:gliding motility-associated C-terminal domain-containing protein [Fibrella aquatilis]|uniref:Gliding motility-associated C-terminal domain-containing protein n=1 Tax=Fibrella aquatilis TaxID=2817059 RepID=A0A939G8D6_9BACT|nr:gliding motility-associated C-terminal domain-containing protein [Fibrella aquatilis]MBO0934099.1 gliding motility-associated C-terminal domain-containing protein [Fibrella aquatilis]
MVRALQFVRIVTLLGILNSGIMLTARASHIFGGCIGLRPVTGSANYQLYLNLYADLENMSAQDLDDIRSNPNYIKLFRKRDNKEVYVATLTTNTIRDLIYDNQACAKKLRFRTREYRFVLNLQLREADYADAGGYYMVWDRCCRNGAVSNLSDPRNANILLYSEFPALFQNGRPITYSSPEFSTLNGDYVCLNRTFTFDFSAADADGDELRYSLVTPYEGISTLAFPYEIPEAGPYPLANWAPGYSLASIIPGPVPLRIDARTGQLTVRASQLGVFVFVVQVDEYRKGQKIGSVRHEFQLPVIDCPKQAISPAVITYLGQPVEQLTICPGQTITLETLNDPSWAFQWQQDGDNAKGATASKLVVDKPGQYVVVKSLATQCAGDTASKPVAITIMPANTRLSITAQAKGFCAGDSVLLTAPVANSIAYEWYRNGELTATGPKLTARQSGIYKLKGKVGTSTCGLLSDSVSVDKWPLPVLPLLGQSMICPKDSMRITTTENADWRYQWMHNGKIVGTKWSLMLRDTGSYYVNVFSEHNCLTRSSMQVVSYNIDCPTDRLFIPNAFSPNHDGLNDRWEIININRSPGCEVYVYNRWGELVFQSTGYDSPWDGTYRGEVVAANVYSYVIVQPSLPHRYSGTLTVLK